MSFQVLLAGPMKRLTADAVASAVVPKVVTNGMSSMFTAAW
jgi:hypothetical protein